jgi:adenylosuccinate synthase
MMKGDVLDSFETIKVCTHYIHNGEKIDYFPYSISDEHTKPVYEEIKGWKTDTTKLTNASEIPVELQNYIDYLEGLLETPISIVSVGPDRTQTIVRKEEAFA